MAPGKITGNVFGLGDEGLQQNFVPERITNLLLLLITLYKEYVPAFTQEDDSVDG